MNIKQSIFSAVCRTVLVGGTLLLPVVNATDTTYKISIKRANPSEPISRDGILSAVKAKFKGRILSVQEKKTSAAPDCHIVRMLALDGEYMVIQVACG